MLTLRYIVRLVSAFIKRFKALIVLGILLGFVIFIVARTFLPKIVSVKKEIIGYTGRYHADELPTYVLDYISDGLTKINEDGSVSPALAENWEQEEDGKVWIFHLKDDITWQDGLPVTSQSINYTFSDVQISYPDEKTIRFDLDTAFAPFPIVVSRPVFRQGLLGTDKWQVQKLSLSGNYVDEINLEDKQGNKKTLKYYPTEEATKLGFKLGEVDKLGDLFSPDPFQNWSVVDVSSVVNHNQFVAVFFNTLKRDDPDNPNQLASKEIRQALSYAIDKGDFGYERAISPISPDSWAYNPQVKTYEYNSDRAKEILEDQLGDVDLEIKLVTSPVLLSDAEKVAHYWNEIGVKTNVQVSSIVPTEYDAYLIAYDIPEDPDQYALWHSVQMATNISNLQNERIDKLLEDGRLEIDKEERKKIYIDFQRFLLEEAPAVFLYHPNIYNIERK